MYYKKSDYLQVLPAYLISCMGDTDCETVYIGILNRI